MDAVIFLKGFLSQGAWGLETDHQKGAAWVVNMVLEVLKNTAPLQHATRGNDDARTWAKRCVHRVVAVFQPVDVIKNTQGDRESLWMTIVNLGEFVAQGAIHMNIKRRHNAFLHPGLQEMDHHLGAAQTKGGDEYLAAFTHCSTNGQTGLLGHHLHAVVQFAAVSAFANQIITDR